MGSSCAQRSSCVANPVRYAHCYEDIIYLRRGRIDPSGLQQVEEAVMLYYFYETRLCGLVMWDFKLPQF